jgi:hypothetical protein
MARLMLGLAVLIGVLLFVLVVVLIATRDRDPIRPDNDAGNEQWERYYWDLAEQARRSEDDDSAASYESLAATYSTLRGEDS